jgi:hypothetical protein
MQTVSDIVDHDGISTLGLVSYHEKTSRFTLTRFTYHIRIIHINEVV